MPAKGLFGTYHPSICMLFFIAAICFSFCSMHPIYILITVVMACLYALFLKGPRAIGKRIAMFVPFVVFIALLNSLFNGAGATALVTWKFITITKEGIWYGVGIGGMLVAVLMWFSCYNEVMTEDKFTYLFGKVLPTLSLMISMISRWVPTMLHRGRTINDSQEALIGGYDGTKQGRFGRGVRLANVLVGLGMEDSIQTSDSMRARGYGTSKRTSYARYGWHARETVVFALLVVLIAINIVGMYVATSAFEYYPTMTPITLWWGYIPYVIMLAIPLIVEAEALQR